MEYGMEGWKDRSLVFIDTFLFIQTHYRRWWSFNYVCFSLILTSLEKKSQGRHFAFIISIKYLFICWLIPYAMRIIYTVQCIWKYC
jgi:hypothetical protein